MKPLCCGIIKQGIQTTYIFRPDRVEREVTIVENHYPIIRPERRENLEQYRANA